jgi:hypothetical protein
MKYAFHKRSEWLPFSSFGMSGPSQDQSAVRQITIHYNGGNSDLDGPDNVFQDKDYARVLAAMNDDYWTNPDRLYALGYNFGCAPDGDLWEIRGFDIRCAANGCQPVNVPAIAVQITTRFIEAEATAEQLDAVKNHWIPWLRTQYPKANLVINTHASLRSKCPDGGSTPCPGPTIEPLVLGQFFDIADPDSDERRLEMARNLPGGRQDFVGPAGVTLAQALAWAATVGGRPELIETVAPVYWELAPVLGLRPEVPFAQAMIETANFRFTRCPDTVCPDFCNPCGMRTADLKAGDPETPQNHQRFRSWHEGVQAHLDHLALYLQLPGYPRAQTPDPRHFPFLLGRVESLTNLGDHWVKGGAAAHPEYGERIRERVDRMRGMPGGGPIIESPPPTPEKDEFDMATIADLETALRTVLSSAAGFGTTGFDQTIQEILKVGQDNRNDIMGVRNSLDNAVGEGTLSFPETIRVLLAVVQGNTNELAALNSRLDAIEGRLAG